MNISEIITDFIQVCKLAKVEMSISDIVIETLNAGEEHSPKKLPQGKMAIYIFTDNTGKCYKVGKAGANSNARYQSQHYNPQSAKSNLAKSLMNDYELNNDNLIQTDVSSWIKKNTSRVNLLIDGNKGIFILNLLEAFIQNRLNPKYEGHKSQRL